MLLQHDFLIYKKLCFSILIHGGSIFDMHTALNAFVLLEVYDKNLISR